jgi:hypothetical protein
MLALLGDAKGMLTVPLFAGLAPALGLIAIRRRLDIAGVAVLGLAWLALVAYMTNGGFSGNQRYLITPIALFIVLSGAGMGWLLTQGLARVNIGAARWAAVAAAVVLAGVFAAPSVNRFSPTMSLLGYQAQLVNSLPALVDKAGGADALRGCGTPYTGPYLVPVVAWNLGIHTSDIELMPARPGVVFREQTLPWTSAVPPLAGFDGDQPARTLAIGRLWRILAACETGAQ